MTSDRFKPPAVARLVARAVAPAADRGDLVTDLDDEAARVAAGRGSAAARRWYRRQVWTSVLPLLRRRFTGSSGPLGALTGFGQDVRLAVRALAASRAFTVSVVLLLAIGIAAHTVVYAVVDAIMLRPLPFGDKSDRLVTLHSIHPTLARDWDDAEVSYDDLIDLRRETAALEQLEGVLGRSVSISNGTETTRELAASVTPGLLPLLGATPVLGRHFRDEEAAPPGAEQVTIVSHRLWETLLGRDPNVIGRTVLINGRPLTIVGVTPPRFNFPDDQQLWLPFRADPAGTRANRALLAVGVLEPGVSFDDGVKALKATAARLAERYPDTNRDWDVHVIRFREFFASGDEAEELLMAVSVLLGIACANVAALMLARGIGRQREVMLRAALGASRLRLFRLLATEGVLVTAIGGALGIGLAGWGIKALVAWIPEPLPYWATPDLDARVVTFAAALTMGVALIAGVVPALRLLRADVSAALLPGVRAAAGQPAHRRLQRMLVVAQVAMSLALLMSAVLLSRSATALLEADGGFDRSPLLSLRFYIAGDRYDAIDARAAAVSEVVRRVAEVPGVRGVTATGAIPTDDGGSAIRVAAAGVAGSFAEIGAQLIPVTPEFWRALGLTLSTGRTFTATESADPATPSVIVNRRMAALMWPGDDAVGRTFTMRDNSGSRQVRVVGVAPDLVYEEFGEVTAPSQLNVYVPYIRAGWRTEALLISAAGDPASLASLVWPAIRAVDPGFAIYDTMTMDARREFNHWSAEFIGRTFTAFAFAALLLACVGAYGIAAYGVQQQRQEIAVRMAIGAGRSRIMRQFIAGGARLAVGGVAVGLPFALIAAALLQSTLFRVSVWQAGPWIALPLALVSAVVAASYFPARRASLIDPIAALRD